MSIKFISSVQFFSSWGHCHHVWEIFSSLSIMNLSGAIALTSFVSTFFSDEFFFKFVCFLLSFITPAWLKLTSSNISKFSSRAFNGITTEDLLSGICVSSTMVSKYVLEFSILRNAEVNVTLALAVTSFCGTFLCSWGSLQPFWFTNALFSSSWSRVTQGSSAARYLAIDINFAVSSSGHISGVYGVSSIIWNEPDGARALASVALLTTPSVASWSWLSVLFAFSLFLSVCWCVSNSSRVGRRGSLGGGSSSSGSVKI